MIKKLFAVVLILLLVFVVGCTADEVVSKKKVSNKAVKSVVLNNEQVKQELIGKNISYFTIAGKEIFYEITEKNIGEIKQISDHIWEVKVGKELLWTIRYHTDTKVIDAEQHFQT